MAQDKRPSDRVASDAGHLLRALRKAQDERAKREKELAASILANREPKKTLPVIGKRVFVGKRKPS